jgi:hypothetical protein
MSRRSTKAQTRVLRRIAQHGGGVILTNTAAGEDFACTDGTPISRRDAKAVLPHMIANKDGLFDFNPHSWRVRKPGDQ